MEVDNSESESSSNSRLGWSGLAKIIDNSTSLIEVDPSVLISSVLNRASRPLPKAFFLTICLIIISCSFEVSQEQVAYNQLIL